MKKIIIITGPTGSGKTELAVKLAKKFNGEIIGADSRQIYRGMKIGTAAPCEIKNKKDFCLHKGVRHYLVGFLKPDKIFSVAEFKEMASKIVDKITRRGKIPIVCGGTAFYIHALTENLSIPKVLPNWKLRKNLEKKDLKILVKQLRKLDKAAFKIVDLKNKRRVIRALEVCAAGLKFSEFRKAGSPVFNVLQIGINVPRKELYKRIDNRILKMVKQGLAAEIKNLIKNGYGPSLPSMSGIGYKEIGEFLKEKITKEEAIKLIAFRTHKYVRGQMGWFRKNKEIKWVRNYKEACQIIKKWLKS
jgi:tRNA dimethylallyltransferase